MTDILNPYPYFPEAGTGGYIYVGVNGMDARANPTVIYRDEAMMLPWVQPIRTVNGYPAYQGAKTGIYLPRDTVSLTVLDPNAVVLTNVTSTPTGMLLGGIHQYGNASLYGSWAAASAATHAAGAAVIVMGDTGTHTDPVVGGVVDNDGVYIYSTSPAGLERVDDLLTTVAAEAAASATASAADAQLQAEVIQELSTGIYFTSTAEGLAGTVDGEVFAVWADGTWKNYLNSGGSAVFKNEIPTIAANDARYIQNSATVDYGTIAAGTTTAGTLLGKVFSGASAGTSDFRGIVEQTIYQGGNSLAEVDAITAQLELRHTAGTITSAFGRKAYARLGLAGSITGGTVTSVRVYDTHVANEGNSAIGTATCYFADGVDLVDGTGAISQMIGFYAGDQGHASRVTSRAVGYRAGDMTAGAPFTAGFHSEMQDGTNKWAFYSEGTAPVQVVGKVGIGSATRPTDSFELFNGYAKICGSTTKFASGSYHEMRTANEGTNIAVLSSSAASPLGVRIRMDNAPNTATGHFLRCDSSTGDMLYIRNNGAVVNQTNSYGAISDVRAKTDIENAPSVLGKFSARRFVTYRLKSDTDGPIMRGVIAQEEQDVSPELVMEDEAGGLTYNYAGLAVETAQAVKELLARIEALEAR